VTGPGAHRGVPLGDIVREAFGNLRARGQRSGLALLGIVVGTASIIAMLNIGHIAQLETLKQFARLGIDMIQVQGLPAGQYPAGFDSAAIEGLPRTDPDVVEATPFSIESRQAFAGPRQAQVMVTAGTPELARVLGLSPRQGRLLREIDACAPVAVVGGAVARQLAGSEGLLGQEVVIGDYLFTVVGVLQPAVNEALSGIAFDDAILIPAPCSRRVLAGPDPTLALIRVREEADVDQVSERLKNALANEATTVQTLNAKTMITARNSQKAVHSRMLVAIGAISLLVGGIGVMNVMLMNVMERRREIGLRAAVGAMPRDIQTMFLCEAAMLATAGGVIGALVGVLATAVVSRFSGWTFSIAWEVLPLGPLGAAVIGLLFGIYPAITAARINPIEALRAD